MKSLYQQLLVLEASKAKGSPLLLLYPLDRGILLSLKSINLREVVWLGVLVPCGSTSRSPWIDSEGNTSRQLLFV
jgi:hypothetical protein